MKHLLTFLCLCAGLTARGREISNTNDLPRPRPVYRYLFLVDTSSAMARQKNVTLDTLSKLIAGGVGGHIHTGEFWNIWTFDDQLHTNVFQAQMWNLAPRNDAANRAARLLRNQTFKNKKGRLAGAMSAGPQARVGDARWSDLAHVRRVELPFRQATRTDARGVSCRIRRARRRGGPR